MGWGIALHGVGLHRRASPKSTVPQEMWGEIVEKLDEFEQHSEAFDVGEAPSMTLTTSPSTRPS